MIALIIGDEGPELVRVVERVDGVLVRVRDGAEVDLVDLAALLDPPVAA